MKHTKLKTAFADGIGIFVAFIVFVVPFIFMFVNSLKDRKEANLMNLSMPSVFHWDNFVQVLTNRNGILLTAFKNSIIITLISVVLLIISCSLAGYVLQRRRGKVTSIVSLVFLSGLMIPISVLPTIWVLQWLNIYKTIFGIVLVEVALQIPFTVMLYRSFVSTIPVELEEAACIDGCGRMKMFAKVIFPLLKPVTATVIILNAVTIFNDFTNPLYFLPGTKNTTVQLTLYNFMGQFQSSYNLLFADVILITVPMLILFIVFNKRIVDGMVAGSVKG